MKNSEQTIAGTGPESIADSKSTQPPAVEGKRARVVRDSQATPPRSAATRRRRIRDDNSEAAGEERFFLASGSGDNGDVPALGRECGSEAEAIIDAFRERVNFYTVSEFQTRADVGPAGEPILRKDGLKKNNPAS
ncbi:MAG: hypothetical protein WCB12_21825 [Bryobacteraceae bacterium]